MVQKDNHTFQFEEEWTNIVITIPISTRNKDKTDNTDNKADNTYSAIKYVSDSDLQKYDIIVDFNTEKNNETKNLKKKIRRKYGIIIKEKDQNTS